MKTPEEIKEGLEACGTDECHGEHTGCPYKDDAFCIMYVCSDALAYINQLEQRLASVDDTLPAWISVKDRLPEYYKDVLVIVRNNGALFTIIAYLTIGGIWVHKGFGRVSGVVNNWMPLPEPPKEDSHE